MRKFNVTLLYQAYHGDMGTMARQYKDCTAFKRMDQHTVEFVSDNGKRVFTNARFICEEV